MRDYGTATWEGGDSNCNHYRDNQITDSCSTGHKNLTGGCGDSIYKEVCKKCGAKRIDKQIGLEPTFEEYVTKLCDIFDEVKRVLRKDGTCWVNIGDTYFGGGRGSDAKLRGSGKGEPTYDSMKDSKPDWSLINYPSKSLCMIPFRFAIEMVNPNWILREDLTLEERQFVINELIERRVI